MLNAILVDDEVRSLDNLAKLLESYCPQVVVKATAQDIDTAHHLIQLHSPDIVFLDIDMPPNTGFDLLKKYEELPFEVIFVTAYDFYAIDAIKFSALYYIMKPIKVEELKEAVKKADKKLSANNKASSQYIRQLHTPNNNIQRIVIKTVKETELIDLRDIYYIEADNVYSTFFLRNGHKITCSQRSVKDYEEMLNGKGFFRCHKSYIVNLKEIASLDRHEGSDIILKNKVVLPLARRRKEELLRLL